MFPRTIPCASAAETVVIGVGNEGVLNGGTAVLGTLTVPSAAKSAVTFRAYARATATSAWGPAMWEAVVLPDSTRNLELEEVRGYDIMVTATQANQAGQKVDVTVSHAIEAVS